MKINRHNLTIVSHCAPNDHEKYITKGLQFNDQGTIAINGAYSVAVTALQVIDKEAVPACVTPEHIGDLLKNINPEGEDISVAHLPRMAGTPAEIKWKRKPAAFEIYLNADFLLKLSQTLCEFCEPTPDADSIVRIQFTGNKEPVRMDARNTRTGQKLEVLLMPRDPAKEAQRQAIPPPPPPVDDDLAAALALAAQLAGN